MKLSEASAKVIALAEAIRAYWDAELPKRHPDYPILHSDEYSGPQPPEQAELSEFLAALSPKLIYQLILVMCLGRGDFGVADLAEQFERVKTTVRTRDRAISLLMKSVLLAVYVADGLDKLARGGIDPDKLLVQASRSRK